LFGIVVAIEQGGREEDDASGAEEGVAAIGIGAERSAATGKELEIGECDVVAVGE
jgi:hypothetical protein